ncbi:TetR/AcrR family transcriptional regulator [Apilactobacillus quenuiae]|uniref:TetR/AcrR family transcriptional regulator n=1 Tax=Apilactobacillus quenuiae TaxID=2008377 RepID=UPI000D018407|nr:TetR/AcrR family transcriptional regulator [Apilactobacillus quenuiae]
MNKSAIRSEERIVNAFFKLLDQNDIYNISVVKICEVAQVSRKTFYKHFSVKEDIIERFFETKGQHYLNSLKYKRFNSFNEVIVYYFEFWNQYKREMQTLLKNNMMAPFFNPNLQPFYEIYRNLNFPWHSATKKNEIAIVSYFFSGGLQSLYLYILKNDCPNKINIIASTLMQAFAKISSKNNLA